MISKFQIGLGLSCAKDFRNLISMVAWCISWYPGSGSVLDCIDSWYLHPYLLWRRLLALVIFQRSSLGWFPIVEGLAMALVYCGGLRAWWSARSRLSALLCFLIAGRWVGLQTLWWFRLKDLSIDEMVGAWCFGCLSGPPGFTCGISFAPVFSFIYCWVLIFALSPCYILIYMF